MALGSRDGGFCGNVSPSSWFRDNSIPTVDINSCPFEYIDLEDLFHTIAIPWTAKMKYRQVASNIPSSRASIIPHTRPPVPRSYSFRSSSLKRYWENVLLDYHLVIRETSCSKRIILPRMYKGEVITQTGQCANQDNRFTEECWIQHLWDRLVVRSKTYQRVLNSEPVGYILEIVPTLWLLPTTHEKCLSRIATKMLKHQCQRRISDNHCPCLSINWSKQ